jgi:replicative DNA helicase
MLQHALLQIEEAHSPKEVLDLVLRDMTKMTTTGIHNDTPSDIHQSIVDEWIKAKETGFIGYPSSLSPVQAILGSYVNPDNIIIAGRPSSGKTALALQECRYIAEEKGVPVGIISLEMRESQLRARLAGSMCGVNTFRMRHGMWEELEMVRMKESFKKLESIPIHIADGRMSASEIQSCAVSMKARHGIEVLMVDYLQLIRRSRSDGNRSPVEVVGEWSAFIKELGQRLDLATILLCQLSRSGHRELDQTPPPPTLEALRSSGEIEQNADVVMMIYKYPGLPEVQFNGASDWPMQLHVAKNRNGPTGACDVTFVRKSQVFTPTMEQHENRRIEGWRV